MRRLRRSLHPKPPMYICMFLRPTHSFLHRFFLTLLLFHISSVSSSSSLSRIRLHYFNVSFGYGFGFKSWFIRAISTASGDTCLYNLDDSPLYVHKYMNHTNFPFFPHSVVTVGGAHDNFVLDSSSAYTKSLRVKSRINLFRSCSSFPQIKKASCVYRTDTTAPTWVHKRSRLRRSSSVLIGASAMQGAS